MFGKWMVPIALFGVVATAQIPLDALGGPVCGMVDPATKVQHAISPSFTRVNVVVTDAIAQAVVTQTFVNPFPAASEAVYLFPLPDQGSVHGMSYRYRDTLYTAKIMEREKAQAIYDSIRQQGGQAALLLQERPNIFQQRLATLGAGETAHVEIRLSMALKYSDGELELAFPTRIGPRFGAPAPKASASPWNPPEARDGPGFQFNVLIESGVDLESIVSPTHPVEVGEIGVLQRALVERQVMAEEAKTTASFRRGVLLRTQATYPNRDYVLRMRPASKAQEFSVASWRHPGGEGYFLLNLYPDAALFQGARPDLDLVLLVDVSGSQQGWPLAREKEIALGILSRLAERDDLTVLSFSDDVRYAFGDAAPRPASRSNVSLAEDFVRGLAAQGGTRLLEAVQASLAVPANPEKKRVYVFLTDGFITNESAILSAIAGHPSRPTIFTFGAGNNLNRYFLEECAKVGNGFATTITEHEAVGPLVESAWGRIESPQLEDISVDFGGMQAAEVQMPVSRSLYRGLPFQVTGKYAQGGTHTVVLTAKRAGETVRIAREVSIAGEETLSWAVPKLWAREKIGRLMLAQGTGAENRPAILALSVEHQVLSAYTAFLAAAPQVVQGGSAPTSLESSLPGGLARGGDALIRVRGGLLRLDWNTPDRVQAIRILDLCGKVLFTFVPGKGAPFSRWIWDGRLGDGRLLAGGRYILAVQGGAGLWTRAFLWNPTDP